MIGRPPPDTIEPTGNITAFFTYWVERTPDRIAIVFPQSSRGGELNYDEVTFRELDEDANRLAGNLARLGVVPGDRVLIMIPMSRPLYALLIAVMKLGACAVFLDPWVPLPQMQKAAELVEPKVFAGISKAHLLRLTAPFRKIPLKLVALSRWPLLPRLLGRSVESLTRRGEPTFELANCSLDDTALITFTTGSTGTPKGSNRTQFFLNAQGVALKHHLPRQEGDIDMPALPVFVLNNLGAGVPSVLPLVDFTRISSVDPLVIVQQINDWKVTTFGGSPSFLLPIARHCYDNKLTLDTVRGVVTGGAPVPPLLLRLLRAVCPQAKGNIAVLYGSTEAEPVSKIEAEEVLAETATLTEEGRGNCVGVPVDDIRLKIVKTSPGEWNLNGQSWHDVECLAPYEVGEVLVSGDHVQKDYYRNPDAVRENKVSDKDGVIWHRMGDLAYRDERQRLWLVGRVSDAVVLEGRVLYPIQVESRAEGIAGVDRAGLVEFQGKAVLVVAPREGSGSPELAEEVLRACQGSGFALDEVRFHGEIPLDPRHNSKVDHRRLCALLEEQAA